MAGKCQVPGCYHDPCASMIATAMQKLGTHHRLDHVRPLGPQVFDTVKHVHNSLSLDTVNGYAQGTECASSTNTSTTQE